MFARACGLVAAAPAPGVTMESWIVWLVLAALLGVAEVLTTTLALGLLAVAALVAAIVGGVGLGLPFQLGAFAITVLPASLPAWCCPADAGARAANLPCVV